MKQHVVTFFNIVFASGILSLLNGFKLTQFYSNWSSACQNQFVPRNDDGGDYLTIKVNWTMNSDTIREFDKGNGSPHCINVTELTRTIIQPVVNYTCQVPFVFNCEINSIFQQYSTVFWTGDSLTRHMSQALHILMTQDLQYGGYPPNIGNKSVPYNYCSCDGQFSEAKVCREFDQDFHSIKDMRTHFKDCPQIENSSKTEFIGIMNHGVPTQNMFFIPTANDTRSAEKIFEDAKQSTTVKCKK
jgi:hypothetical protein